MWENSPKIARAWLDTVLNPLYKGLSSELYYLDKNNLTWKGINNSFEYMKPIQYMLDFEYSSNFEQMIDFFPNLSSKIDEHDQLLENLKENCTILFEILKFSDELRTLYNQELTKYSNSIGENSKESVIDLSHPHNLRFVAEYIINDRGDLDSSYLLSSIWNNSKNLFKDLLKNEKFQNYVLNKNLSLFQFKNCVIETISDVKIIRNKISFQTGEPIVQPMLEIE